MSAGKAVQHQDCTQSFFAQLQVSRLVSIVRRSCLKIDTSREIRSCAKKLCVQSWCRFCLLRQFNGCPPFTAVGLSFRDFFLFSLAHFMAKRQLLQEWGGWSHSPDLENIQRQLEKQQRKFSIRESVYQRLLQVCRNQRPASNPVRCDQDWVWRSWRRKLCAWARGRGCGSGDSGHICSTKFAELCSTKFAVDWEFVSRSPSVALFNQLSPLSLILNTGNRPPRCAAFIWEALSIIKAENAGKNCGHPGLEIAEREPRKASSKSRGHGAGKTLSLSTPLSPNVDHADLAEEQIPSCRSASQDHCQAGKTS